jgi:integrase/recombinase XerD
MMNGCRRRFSLDTFSVQEASRKLLELASQGNRSIKSVLLRDAIDQYLADGEDQELKRASMVTRKWALGKLTTFTSKRAIIELQDVDRRLVKACVEETGFKGGTKSALVRRLRAFFNFCVEEEMIDVNPAKKIRTPRDQEAVVIPFLPDEHDRIIAAIATYRIAGKRGAYLRARLYAFVLLLRYTGLRISDAVQFRPERINNGRLLIRTTKNDTPVCLVLPKILLDALTAIQIGQSYYFWSGRGTVKSATCCWEIIIQRLLKRAQVKGHSHMYRHTLAIELLEKGVLVEHVAAILGNTPQTVYKHYAPWIKSRQDALDSAIKKIWDESS